MKKRHLLILTILLLAAITFSIIQLSRASSTNPGHPASDIGGTTITDRTFQSADYSFSDDVGIGVTEPNAPLQVANYVNFNPTNQITALGYQTYNAAAGLYGTFVGYQAGKANTTNGNYNAFVGWKSGTANTSGTQNTALGVQSLMANTTGGYNTALGVNALITNTTASNSTAIGVGALYNNNATGNVAIGMNALYDNASGVQNMALGTYALEKNTQSYNVALGYAAQRYKTTGQENVAIGYGAGQGSSGNSTFANNTLIGSRVGEAFTSGSNNTVIGYHGGLALTTGGNNILLGYQAGDNLTTGAGNIIIGHDIDATAVGSASTLNIGNVIKGDLTTGSVGITGSLGVGTTGPPDEKFAVEWVADTTDVEIGRGTTDTDVTFLTLRSQNGTKFYITVTDAGGLSASATKP